MLENIPITELRGEILEVGCGYGVVPIILSKVCEATIDGVDVNKRAISLALKNSEENSCKNINFYESNCYESINKKYDFIINFCLTVKKYLI